MTENDDAEILNDGDALRQSQDRQTPDAIPGEAEGNVKDVLGGMAQVYQLKDSEGWIASEDPVDVGEMR